MSGHTPGPWWVSQGTEPYANRTVRAFGNRTICRAHLLGAQHDEAEAEANAHLTAAAPDLLAVLKEWDEPGACGCDTFVCRDTCLPARTRRAIAKAEARP
jgi:hypothetical protein